MASTYDTYIELLPLDEQSLQRGTYTYGYNKHIAIRGFQKLINIWAKAFLTLEGSDLSDRDYGTPFSALIGSNISEQAEIQEITQSSVDKANTIVRARQAQNPPEDPRELLDSGSLTSLIFSGDNVGFEAYVLIKNQAGESLQVLFPGTTP
jgi:hypothetical protein